jgi:chromosome segregation ATPase
MVEAAQSAETLATSWESLGSDAETATGAITTLDDAAVSADTDLAGAGDASSELGDSLAALADAASSSDDALASVDDSATAAAASIADVDDAVQSADADASQLGSDLGDTAAAADTVATSAADLADSLAGADSATEELASDTADLNDAVEESGQSAEEASSEFGDMAEQMVSLAEGIAGFEVLKDLGSDAITAAGSIQQATVSLQALGMSGEQASETIENLEQLAVNDALQMPDLLLAQQRMTALGVPLGQISTLITDAAGAANTMNVSFSRVVQQIDNMVASGTVSVSTLTRMGISAQSFVGAINQVAGEGTADVNDLTTAFAGLSKTQSIQVVELAMQNLGASVAAQAATIPGQIQIIKTSFDLLLEDVGKNIAPATGAVVGELQTMLSGFLALPAPIKEVTEDAIALTVAIVALAAAAGAASVAIESSFGAATIGAITGVGAAVSGFFTEIVGVVTGLEGAAAAMASVTIAAGALAVGIGAIIGWKLGPAVSDWVMSLLGFGTAAEAAAANAKEASGGVEQLTTTATGGTGATSAYAAALQTLGVSLADVPQKTKDAVTAVQSWAQTAAAAAQQATNVGNANKNAAQTFSATAQLYAAGLAGLTQYTTALDAYDKAQMAANNGLESAGTAALLAVNAYQNLVVTASNADTTFTAVAQAYSAGQATLSQYTSALTAMNKAQMDANNGIEQAGTAALIAVNDYANLAAKATNAQTTLDAVSAAASSGAISWTQYDTALKQLVTDEEAANNGFLSLATSLAVIQEAFQNLAVTETNAETNLQAATEAMASGSASLSQYTAALQAAYKAQMDLNNGVASFPLQEQMAENAWQNAAAAATNAAVKAQAYYAALQAGYPVLQQTITAVQDAGAAMEKAAGGVVTWQSALLSLQSQQSQLELNLQNANTTLGQAEQMYANGTITLGTYQKAVQAAAQAQAALTGATKTQTSSTNTQTQSLGALTSATTSYNNALKGTTDAMVPATQAMSTFATSLQVINGQFVNLGGQAQTADTALSDMATNTGYVNGQMVTLGSAVLATNTDMGHLGTSLQQINGQLVTMGTDATAAAKGLTSVGTAASNLGSAVGSADASLATGTRQLGTYTDAVDAAGKSINSLSESLDAAMGATPGNLSMSLSAGQTFNEPTGLVSGIGDTDLIQDPTWLNTYGGPNATANVNPLPNTPSIYDSTSAITEVTKGAQSATSAVAALSTAATSAATALGTVATTTESVTQAQQTLNTDYQTYITTGQGLAQVLTDFQTLQEANNEAMGGTTTALNDLATGATDATTALSGSGGVSDALQGVAQGATIVTQSFNGAAGAITGDIVPSLNALNDGFTPLTTSLEGLSTAQVNATNYVDTFYQAVNTATPPMIAVGNQLGTLSQSLQGLLPVIGEVTKSLNQVNVNQPTGGLAAGQFVDLTSQGISMSGGNLPEIGTPNSNLSNYDWGYGFGNGQLPAPGGGFGGGATGADMLSSTSTVPASSSITLQVNAGTIVGQGGMQQLTNMIGQSLVSKLASLGIRLNRQ